MPGNKKRPPLTWAEGRRLRAWELHKRGWTNSSIADALGVSEPAVCHWVKLARTHGAAALCRRRPRGKRSRLSKAQLRAVPKLLMKGPQGFGFEGDVWTCRRIATVIAQEVGVRYHPDHVRKIMRALKWSLQKPLVRASARDETAIAIWLTVTWPAIKTRAEKEARTIVFIDETAFYLRPTVVRTWSPTGHPSVLHKSSSRKHLSVIGGITYGGSLYVQVQSVSFRTRGVVEFLRHILFHIPGNILVVWDNVRIHKSKELMEFLALDTIGRMTFEHFPPYAPELDPQEYVWRHLKHVDLRNLTPRSLDDLWAHVRAATRRLRRRAGLLRKLAEHARLL
jgi:transposase